MNPDIQKERRTATFNTNKLTHILDGGDGITERRRYIENLALKEKVFTEGPDYVFLSRSEKYDRGMKKSMHFIKKSKELKLDSPADSYWYKGIAFPLESAPIAVHNGMFVPSINGQGTPEQVKKWGTLAKNYDIVGTYAQTELGHGTHLRGVETTATYDPATEEFVLNSPTLTSAKWWPGGLGKTSNYVVLMAILHSRGQNCGMQPFIVQIRDMETHQPLPGVKVGDIGPKLGYDMIDNGYLMFDNVRIPRDQMLMKNAQVLKDGTFVKSKNSKLSYGTMVFVRSMIVMDVCGKGMAMAATIAIRYSSVRRQSELKPGAPEPQILDYQTQQHKLFPLLSSAYAFIFAGRVLRDIYFSTNYEIQQGNTEALPELHALSSCLKAYTSDITMFGIEQCRLACGGHGYSQASGFPKLYATCTPAATYEGENTVLYLQTARFLLKAHAGAQSGKQQLRSLSYISDPVIARSALDQSLSIEQLVKDYKHRAARLVNKAGTKYQMLLGNGHPDWEARNMCAVDLVKASKAHAHQWIVDNFVEQIQREDPSPERQVLTTLCKLYAVHGISENHGDFIEDGYMSPAQINIAQESVLNLLAEIRPNAVALVDAFDFRDHLLCSVLGRYDGKVYENLIEWVKASPLNKTEVHESFHKYIKPLREEMKAMKSNL